MPKETFSSNAYVWLANTIGAKPSQINLRTLKGATSSMVLLGECAEAVSTVVTERATRQATRFVLRVFNNQTWLKEEPDLAVHEAAALKEAAAAGLAAPKLLAFSQTDIGFGGPVTVMSFLPGDVVLMPADLSDWIEKLAAQLASIHAHDAPAFRWRFQSWLTKEKLKRPTWTRVPKLWDEAIILASRGFEQLPAQDTRNWTFIHRDYHPANVLWSGDAISGVVDWINACRGPRGVDVAHCRTNLALMHGHEASAAFLAAYQAAAPQFIYDRYWDVESVIEMCLPRPVFYEPWQEFGLLRISDEMLCERLDCYLESIFQA